MKALVFCEHHEGGITKGSLGVLSKAATLGGEVAGVAVGAGIGGLGDEAGAHCATGLWVADGAQLAAPLPPPRVDVLAKLVRDQGYHTGPFASAGLAADGAARLFAR